MTRVEDQIWRQEQNFLYSTGCQMQSEFELAYECDCGRECETGEEHKVFGGTMCPNCYSKFVENLRNECSQIIQTKFEKEEIEIMCEEGILGNV